ncbi:MAG: peptidylprolyl isomerase [Abditibacteriota bacterium]|nr:peptidylprolyl isomerase [Abditibacteriota bacterium]
MKKYISLIVVILVIGLVALFNSVSNSMKGEEKPMDTGHSNEHGPKLLDATLVFNNVIVLETTGGNIEIAVLRKDIPNASKRMLALAKKDQFKDIPVVTASDWLVQFDELPAELEPLHYETANNLLSGNYAVGLAHRKSPDSGTSSVFIIREPSFSVLDSYTIFGYVVKGQDVVDGLTGEDSIIKSSVRGKTAEDAEALVAVFKQAKEDYALFTQFQMKADAMRETEMMKKMSESLPGKLEE